MVSATARATRVGVSGAGVGCAGIGAGGIAGIGKGARALCAACGQDGAMNGAGVMVVATSSKFSGTWAGLSLPTESTRFATGRAAAAAAVRVGAAGRDCAAGALAPPSLLINGLGRAAGAASFIGAPEGSFGPGGPIPSVVARPTFARCEMRGDDSSIRSASETLSASSESKRGSASAAGGFENGF